MVYCRAIGGAEGFRRRLGKTIRSVSVYMLRNLTITGVLALLMVVILACGEAAAPTKPPAPTAAPTATTAPAATEVPTEAAMEATEAPTEAAMEVDDDIEAVAARLAGGPGAFYVGDLNHLVGPVPEAIEDDIGDNEGVPYEGLEDFMYVFGSDYYRMIVERANLTNPTEATTTGMELSYQFACINRALTHCKLAEWWSDEVYERTNGQLRIEIIGYPELGIAGTGHSGAAGQRHSLLRRTACGLHCWRPARHGHEVSLGHVPGQRDFLQSHRGLHPRPGPAD